MLEGLVIWPKLFRRIVPYLASGFPDFDSFDSWLRADPVHRDDELFPLDRLERGNMHDVVCGVGNKSSSRSGPRTSSSAPTRQRGGGGTGPGQVAVGVVLIVAASQIQQGWIAATNWVTLLNTTAASIDLTGWGLVDATGGRQELSGPITGGGVVRSLPRERCSLATKGDTVVLVDPSGASIDQVTYKADRAVPSVLAAEATVGDSAPPPV